MSSHVGNLLSSHVGSFVSSHVSSLVSSHVGNLVSSLLSSHVGNLVSSHMGRHMRSLFSSHVGNLVSSLVSSHVGSLVSRLVSTLVSRMCRSSGLCKKDARQCLCMLQVRCASLCGDLRSIRSYQQIVKCMSMHIWLGLQFLYSLLEPNCQRHADCCSLVL